METGATINSKRVMQACLFKLYFQGEQLYFAFFLRTFYCCMPFLSLVCSVCLFCSPNVMLQFIPNLLLFSTTNHDSPRFVFRTTNCLFLIQALNPFVTLSSPSPLSPFPSAPCYLWNAELQGQGE